MVVIGDPSETSGFNPAGTCCNRFLLPGIFQMLGYLPANRQFNISVDAHIDDHRAVFDGESLVDLAEVIGPIDSEALGAKANSQFLEIRLGDFGIFRRQALVDQIDMMDFD